MAGFYPKPLTAAGHDGLWYWTQARTMTAQKQHWNAWLYYQQAENLLSPVGFIQSTHLEKLKTEESAAAPPALSEGVSAEAPLVVKGPDGAEYHFTGLGVDDSLSNDKIDIMAHLKVDQIGDPVTARKRNLDAMVALLAAYPEMRKPFHGPAADEFLGSVAEVALANAGDGRIDGDHERGKPGGAGAFNRSLGGAAATH